MQTYPTGTITFLFTDVEGSTRLWETYPEAMRTALARHDALVRAAIADSGGHVFKTVGDAFCAAFSTAPAALSAALKAQRALAAEAWGETGPLRARMALHSGAVEERDGDYFGPPLNRVARLRDAGHGGQVLLSLAAQELARDQLEPGVGLLDMGERRLKDLSRPERVYQAVAPGLPTSFPALRTLDSRPNNLPAQPTPLVGREKEAAEVGELMRRPEVRLVTLTGPGGTGKTRLALQAAADLVDRFDAGVYFVSLAPVEDPGLVPAAVSAALGLRDASGKDTAQRLAGYLKDREMLLVLDNFEQVVAGATAVAELMGACSGLKVLATSREPLRLRGEHQYPVPALRLPDLHRLPPVSQLSQYEAVTLFIERAVEVLPDFVVTNDNAPAVAEICHRLEGLPLAIELAAARVKLFPPQALLARLSGGLGLLTGGARDMPARQRTLRSTVAWSYDLLDVTQKRLFCSLSVFSGGFAMDGAEAVADVGGQTADGVSALLDKSLLKAGAAGGGEPRFVMLEMIRAYGLERLAESGEEGDTRERHAACFEKQAELALGG